MSNDRRRQRMRVQAQAQRDRRGKDEAKMRKRMKSEAKTEPKEAEIEPDGVKAKIGALLRKLWEFTIVKVCLWCFMVGITVCATIRGMNGLMEWQTTKDNIPAAMSAIPSPGAAVGFALTELHPEAGRFDAEDMIAIDDCIQNIWGQDGNFLIVNTPKGKALMGVTKIKIYTSSPVNDDGEWTDYDSILAIFEDSNWKHMVNYALKPNSFCDYRLYSLQCVRAPGDVYYVEKTYEPVMMGYSEKHMKEVQERIKCWDSRIAIFACNSSWKPDLKNFVDLSNLETEILNVNTGCPVCGGENCECTDCRGSKCCD